MKKMKMYLRNSCVFGRDTTNLSVLRLIEKERKFPIFIQNLNLLIKIALSAAKIVIPKYGQ